MDREQIFRAILEERDAQDLKFGNQTNNTLAEWMTILGEEFGETCQEALKLTFGGITPERLQRYIDETIQVAAVAVAMLEHVDFPQIKSVPPGSDCSCGRYQDEMHGINCPRNKDIAVN